MKRIRFTPSFMCVGICIVALFYQQIAAQSIAENLNTYERRSIITLSKLSGRNISGVSFNVSTKTLFIVDNSKTVMYEITTAGVLIRTIYLDGFYDTEDLAFLNADNFMVIEEGKNVMVHCILPPAGHDTLYYSQCTKMPIDSAESQNAGLEGISYHAASNTIYICKEKQPPRLYRVPLDSNFHGKTVIKNSPFNIEKFSGDAAGLYALNGDTILLLNQEANFLLSYDAAGNKISQLPLEMTQPEGVTVDPNDKTIYVVGEPNELAVFKNSKIALQHHLFPGKRPAVPNRAWLRHSDRRFTVGFAQPGLLRHLSARIYSMKGTCWKSVLDSDVDKTATIVHGEVVDIASGIYLVEYTIDSRSIVTDMVHLF